MQQLTLNNILDIIKEFADNHQQVHTYATGKFSEVAADNRVQYPLLYVELANSIFRDKTIDLSFNILCGDLVRHDQTNRQEVHSDCLQILNDLRTYLERSTEFVDFIVQPGSPIEPVTMRFNDDISGWIMKITLSISNLKDLCNIPLNPFNAGNYSTEDGATIFNTNTNFSFSAGTSLKVFVDSNNLVTYTYTGSTSSSGSSTYSGTNLGSGYAIYTGNSGNNLQFKTLLPGSNVTFSQNANTITINSTGGGSYSGSLWSPGGGTSSVSQTVAGLPTNNGNYALVAGVNNYSTSNYSTVFGRNSASQSSNSSAINGGKYHQVTYSSYSIINGGAFNQISSIYANQNYNTILGGTYNLVYHSYASMVGIGSNNQINSTSHSSILTGKFNTINAPYSIILNGVNNTINAGADNSAIVGASNKTVSVTGMTVVQNFRRDGRLLANQTYVTGVGTYNFTDDDYGILFDTSSPIVVVLPASPEHGREVWIKDATMAGSSNLRLDGAGIQFEEPLAAVNWITSWVNPGFAVFSIVYVYDQPTNRWYIKSLYYK